MAEAPGRFVQTKPPPPRDRWNNRSHILDVMPANIRVGGQGTGKQLGGDAIAKIKGHVTWTWF